MKYVASALASLLVLYSSGKNCANKSMKTAITVQLITEKAIILLSVSRASFILPAPRSCPTMMATESPKARNTMLNTLLIVLEILSAAMTFNPRIE